MMKKFLDGTQLQNWVLYIASNFYLTIDPSPVWDEAFPSVQEALSVALDGIKAAGGIQAFSEPSDLEAKKIFFLNPLLAIKNETTGLNLD